ncbi:MAG: hypothetical protein IPO65_20375 [Saprospiraceae bacterium]|nr:hypothetical protein [Saprospiraceae bacterium]
MPYEIERCHQNGGQGQRSLGHYPGLHYDLENKNFTELVSVNLGQKTKYRYIVPASKEIKTNIEKQKRPSWCNRR